MHVIDDWPSLPLEQWGGTYHTLHMWTQIIGKIRRGLAPLRNHWWNEALYVNTRGLTTRRFPITIVSSNFNSTSLITGWFCKHPTGRNARLLWRETLPKIISVRIS